MVEFNCCECGGHVVSIMRRVVPEPPLCLNCLWMPGWNDDPYLRAMLAPGMRVTGAAMPPMVNGHPVHHWAGRKPRNQARLKWKIAFSRRRWHERHAPFLTRSA